mgnify:CR=1 FL=1
MKSSINEEQEPLDIGGLAPLPSRWNKGIDLVHIDLRSLDELIESIDRQIRFKRYPFIP